MDSDVSLQPKSAINDKVTVEPVHQLTATMPSKSGSSSTISLSDESDIEPDELVSTINHNTESSMAALKDMTGDEREFDSSLFLRRYFQNHSNSLPSRVTVAARRLSQCREEDEDEEKKDLKEQVPSNSNMSTISGSDKSLSESSSGSKTSVIDTVSGPTHKFVVTKTKQPSEAAKIFASRQQYRQANTVHAIPPHTDYKRPSLYNIFKTSPHYDTRFFDSSLIEMKNQTSSSSTIDCSGSAEDIWVKRSPTESQKELGSQPLPTITSDDVDTQSIPRPRSGTWGSKADSKQKSKDVAKPKAKEGKSKQPKEAKTEGKKDRKRDKHSGSRSGSASRSNSAERRKSGDDVQSPKKAGMLDAFRARSNSDASKKKGSAFMASMKSAMLHTGLMHARKAPRDGSAHPVRDGSSHTQYYHTVTAASSNKSPMTKVMDIFRNRSHASVPPEDRRKKAAQQLAGESSNFCLLLRERIYIFAKLNDSNVSIIRVELTGNCNTDVNCGVAPTDGVVRNSFNVVERRRFTNMGEINQ
jgi:hypothetical protein